MLGSKVAPRTSLHTLSGVLQQTWMQKIWCTMLWTDVCFCEYTGQQHGYTYEQSHLCLSCIESSCFKWIGTSWIWGPGRIDKMFHLNYMIGEQACKMIAHYFQQDCREPPLICNTVILRLRRSWIWKLPRVLQLHWVGKYRTQQIRKQRLDVSMRSHLRCLHTAGCKCGYPGGTPTEFLLDPTFALSVTLVGPWDYSSTSGATLCGTWQSGGKSQETRNTTSLVFS